MDTNKFQPGSKVKVQIDAKEEKYESGFSVYVVPRHKGMQCLANANRSSVMGDLGTIFKDFSKEQEHYPGFTSGGTYEAKGHCIVTKVVQHIPSVRNLVLDSDWE